MRYLEAEYNFAVSSAQMAASWAEVSQDGDRYDLQYRTAGDDHVREEHRALNGVTLPPSNDFWRYYYPPNGWNCRCTAVQVRKGKYPTSDAGQAMEAGRRTTDTPKKRIFRFNPGIDGQLFPPKHPYYKLSREAAGQVKKGREGITGNGARTGHGHRGRFGSAAPAPKGDKAGGKNISGPHILQQDI